MKNEFFAGFGHDGYWGPVKKREFAKWADRWNGWCGRYEKVGGQNLYLRELRGYVGTAPEHGEVIARRWFREPFDGKRYRYALYRVYDDPDGFDYKPIVTNRNHPEKIIRSRIRRRTNHGRTLSRTARLAGRNHRGKKNGGIVE